MVAFELEGVEIDRCLACEGTWLDAGELELIVELSGVPTGELTAAIEGLEEQQRTRRRCPRCPRRLRRVQIGKRDEIELDHCPNRCGLWFDRGELAAVIDSYAEGEKGAVAHFFADLYRHEYDSNEKGD